MMNKIRYIELLRGINVGGNRIIKNADLKACFEEMGLTEVVVILQSGNVIFSNTDKNLSQLKALIEDTLQKRFDFPAKVIIQTKVFIRKILEVYPFDHSNSEEQHYIVFLSTDIVSELMKEAILDLHIEQIMSGDGVIYWKVTKGMTLKSKFGKILSKSKYKDLNTVRNINTLQKVIGV